MHPVTFIPEVILVAVGLLLLVGGWYPGGILLISLAVISAVVYIVRNKRSKK